MHNTRSNIVASNIYSFFFHKIGFLKEHLYSFFLLQRTLISTTYIFKGIDFTSCIYYVTNFLFAQHKIKSIENWKTISKKNRYPDSVPSVGWLITRRACGIYVYLQEHIYEHVDKQKSVCNTWFLFLFLNGALGDALWWRFGQRPRFALLLLCNPNYMINAIKF